MKGEGVNWQGVYSVGYPKLYKIFEMLSYTLNEEQPEIFEYLNE